MFRRVGGKMKINYVIVDVARAWTLHPFLPQQTVFSSNGKFEQYASQSVQECPDIS